MALSSIKPKRKLNDKLFKGLIGFEAIAAQISFLSNS